MSSEFFTGNLRHACSTRRSVSEVCREIGINRQQFNRYLSGEALPSPYNLTRIAAFFGLTAQELELAPREFESRLARQSGSLLEADILRGGFPGDLAQLRRHLGYYQTYHVSLSWPGSVICSAVRLHEAHGSVLVKSIERNQDRPNEIRQFSKYVGLAAFWRNRIFIVERSIGAQPLIAQTILTPFEAHQRVYMRGITMGVSWRKENQPYASRMIWRHLGADTDKRALLGKCGVHPKTSPYLPSAVRAFLEIPDGQLSLGD